MLFLTHRISAGLAANMRPQLHLTLRHLRQPNSAAFSWRARGCSMRPMSRRCCSTNQAATRTQSEGAPPPTTITFQQGAKAATRGVGLLALGGVVVMCGVLIGREIMPTRMSPNSVFNSAFEKIRDHPEVVARVGDNIKAYGKEYNSHKEGRRNFVSHHEFKDLDDHKHVRVKFTLEGSRGKASCYAEVSDELEPGEFAYIIIEQIVRGRSNAIALVDNRRQYTREELQEKVSKKLAKLDATLYGHSHCQWTHRQQMEFGDYVSNIKVILCDKDDNASKCEKAQLKGYPSWVIKGEQLPGFQPLEQLKEIVQQM